ncbi:MAG: 30S ribosomal protein S20 [Candidatus Borkfalkiaceae bacterium]|nr:30S ribosomal protein S20 [Christensenellaceae bacterium]
MPNIKSAKKRVIVNAKKTEQNKAIRSAFKTEIKKVEALIKENKLEEAKAALPAAFKVIDSAATKNIIHTNNAAHKKSKLAKKISDAAVSAPVAEPAPAEVKAEEVKAEEPAAEVKEEKPVKKTTRKTAAKKAEEKAE